jgi:hypothetical protein
VQDPNDELRRFLGPIGIFGFVVTLGLFVYELRGMQRCRTLEEQGEALEIEMKLGPELGPFRGQPPRKLGKMLGTPAAGLIIYIATAFAWLLLAPLWVQGVTKPSMGLGSHGRFRAHLGVGLDLALAMPERGAYQGFAITSPVMLSPAWLALNRRERT